MSDFVLVGGERYLRLDVVARWYRVEVAFLEEAVALELLEHERSDDGTGADPMRDVMLPEHALDRVAELLRWQWQTGLDLAALALLLPGR
ncbi:MAG: hypothetical protein JNL90_11640 [Planctomycetes bacterium]|nr:hypothetical protein [Planctomycetota bacterium]